MKKVVKGAPGYLEYKKKFEIIRTIIYFLFVAAIFFLGYTQTHTRKNLLTVVAVVGCLPACKALVGVISRFPYTSIAQKQADEIAEKARHLTVIYDMIITSREKIMPVDCIVISGNMILGYTRNKKVDLNNTATHISNILKQNGCSKVSVKILNNYSSFLARVEGMESMEKVEKHNAKDHETRIAGVILNISM